MKSMDNLTTRDDIAFGFNRKGEKEPAEIKVSSVKGVSNESVLVHFYNWEISIAQWIGKGRILAIKNREGTGVINGWPEKYDVINQEAIDRIVKNWEY